MVKSDKSGAGARLPSQKIDVFIKAHSIGIVHFSYSINGGDHW